MAQRQESRKAPFALWRLMIPDRRKAARRLTSVGAKKKSVIRPYRPIARTNTRYNAEVASVVTSRDKM